MNGTIRTALGKVLLHLERMVRPSSMGELHAVNQVLVIEHGLALGCCVHLSPLFEALKRCRPELYIAVATRGLAAEVVRHSRFVDDIIETANPLTNLSGAVCDLKAGLRSRGLQPDCVLTGVADQRTKISLLAMLGSSGWRGGYTQTPSLYHRPIELQSGQSHIGSNLAVARLLGCEVEALEPRVFFMQTEVAVAADLLMQANPQGRPLVALVTQTSGGQRTSWSTVRFAEVIRAVDAAGYAIVYLGTATEQAAIETIRHAADGIGYSLAGRTNVPELAASLAQCDAAISLDTGTMHVGRAVGLPMVVLGPSWQKPQEWMPLGLANVRILRGEDREDIPVGYELDEIDAADVIAAFDDLMAKFPPSAEARTARVARSLSEIDHLAR